MLHLGKWCTLKNSRMIDCISLTVFLKMTLSQNETSTFLVKGSRALVSYFKTRLLVNFYFETSAFGRIAKFIDLCSMQISLWARRGVLSLWETKSPFFGFIREFVNLDKQGTPRNYYIIISTEFLRKPRPM